MEQCQEVFPVPSEDAALHLAAFNGHTQCIEVLLQVSGIDPDSRNGLKQSPLGLAIRDEFITSM